MSIRETLLDSVGLARQAHMCLDRFRDLPKKPDGADFAKKYRSSIEPTLHAIDKHMTDLVLNDELLLTMWASLMKTSAEKLAVLERNLALPNRSHFHWEEIVAAMALLQAIKFIFTLALQNEGIDIEA